MNAKNIEDVLDRVLETAAQSDPQTDSSEFLLKLYEVLGQNLKYSLALLDKTEVYQYINEDDRNEYFFKIEEPDGTRIMTHQDYSYCSCRNFINNLVTKKGLHCKHIIAIRIAIVLERVKQVHLDLKAYLQEKLSFDFLTGTRE